VSFKRSDVRRQAQGTRKGEKGPRREKKKITTEAQQGDAEMGRDGDAARKTKKNFSYLLATLIDTT
jgi:hypothetical protein